MDTERVRNKLILGWTASISFITLIFLLWVHIGVIAAAIAGLVLLGVFHYITVYPRRFVGGTI